MAAATPGSLAALATLDDNGDGVIDSGDTAFGNLLVWQDLDHDGVSGGGELKSLADHGITEIRLNAAPSEGYLDGQRVVSEGVFRYEDGTSGDFIEVALDVVLGANQLSENEIVGSDNDGLRANHSSVDLISGNNSDTFVFAQNFGRATIGNFTPGTDEIDLNPAIFSDFRALLAATQDVNGSAVITDAAHDTITIEHVTKAPFASK